MNDDFRYLVHGELGYRVSCRVKEDSVVRESAKAVSGGQWKLRCDLLGLCRSECEAGLDWYVCMYCGCERGCQRECQRAMCRRECERAEEGASEERKTAASVDV